MCAILYMLLLWQMCTPLCMPRPISLPFFTSSLLWQTYASLCMPRQIGLPYLTLLLLWQTCASLCVLNQIGLLYFTSSLLWLTFTLFTCSCCWLTPFLILMRLWHCLCSALMAPALVPAMIQTRHDTNWKASCCKEGIPKRFCNDDTMVYGLNIFKMQNRDTKIYVWTSTRQRIVCAASKVTTCSSVYQTCQFVVNSMLRQQGDDTVIICQSCHAIVKQDDSHFI